jgi:hypothetical protein
MNSSQRFRVIQFNSNIGLTATNPAETLSDETDFTVQCIGAVMGLSVK